MKKLLLVLLFSVAFVFNSYAEDKTTDQGTYISVFVEGVGYVIVYCSGDDDDDGWIDILYDNDPRL